MDSVFIFQSSAEETTNISYDAIVVEQWTIVDVSFVLQIRVSEIKREKKIKGNTVGLMISSPDLNSDKLLKFV